MNWFRDVQRWLRLHASRRTGQSSKQPSSVSSTNLKCYQFREGSFHFPPAQQGDKCCGKKQHRHQRRSLNPCLYCRAGCGRWTLRAEMPARQFVKFCRSSARSCNLANAARSPACAAAAATPDMAATAAPDTATTATTAATAATAATNIG